MPPVARRSEGSAWLESSFEVKKTLPPAPAAGTKATAARRSASSRIAANLAARSAVGAPSLCEMRKTAFALLAATVLVAGCGGGKSATHAAGAKVFASADCGGCHELSAAKASGQTGPNLDQLKPSYDAVVRQVSNGGGGMPSFARRLSTNQIRDVASFVAASTKNNLAALTAFRPNRVKLANCRGDYACYKQAFGNIAYYRNPEAPLATLASSMKTNRLINSGCHQIAHEIGHAGYARYHDNAAQALANGSMTCWSGYYHGVIERAFGGLPRPKVASIARSLCTRKAINNTDYLLYQRVHRLGHGR